MYCQVPFIHLFNVIWTFMEVGFFIRVRSFCSSFCLDTCAGRWRFCGNTGLTDCTVYCYRETCFIAAHTRLQWPFFLLLCLKRLGHLPVWQIPFNEHYWLCINYRYSPIGAAFGTMHGSVTRSSSWIATEHAIFFLTKKPILLIIKVQPTILFSYIKEE